MVYMEAYGITALASSEQNENDQIFKNYSNQKKLVTVKITVSIFEKSLSDSDLFTVHLKIFYMYAFAESSTALTNSSLGYIRS